ncbi:CdaR family protein [uncultured Paludibaculum sp.]|uniref:CdaR family protein n=1 Tax=uncultured Paludibaculum sp. TaxID=1765020 RepID=UPI002AAA8295|nr:CdaR family protein [uncultured Paludibaculum sp.]
MMKPLTRNLGWKLASLLAAFVMWLLVSGARELTTSITVPVQYRNIPKSLEISSDMMEQVHLVLRGPSPLLTRLAPGGLPLVIDLSDARTPGQRTFTLDSRNIALPAGVTLERAVPAQIQIRLETRISRDVPVKPQFENMPEGMHIQSAEVTPARLTIVGPQSRVRHIQEVLTDAVDLRMLDSNGNIASTAYSGDAQVNFTTSPSVTIHVTVVPKPSDQGKR